MRAIYLWQIETLRLQSVFTAWCLVIVRLLRCQIPSLSPMCLLNLKRHPTRRHNQKKDAVAAEWEAKGETNPNEGKSLEELLDGHPSYRYMY